MGLYSWGHPFKQFGPESSKFTSLFDKCDMRTAAICTTQWSGWSHRAVKGLAGWMLHAVGNRSHGKSMRVGYGISAPTSAAQTVTLTNSGTGPATISSLYLSGGSASDFEIVPASSTCDPVTAVVTLVAAPGPGNTCVVAITFTAPGTVGTYTTTAAITADLGNNVKGAPSVGITGKVVAGGVIATPSSASFGTVAQGTTIDFSTLNNSTYLTLTNDNTGAITI